MSRRRGNEAIQYLARISAEYKDDGEFKLPDGTALKVQRTSADTIEYHRISVAQKRYWTIRMREGMTSPISQSQGELLNTEERVARAARFEREIQNGQLPQPVRVTPLPGGRAGETYDAGTGRHFETRSAYEEFYREEGLVDVGSQAELEREAARQRRARIEEGVICGDRPTHDNFGNAIPNTIMKVPGNVRIEDYPVMPR